MIMMMSFGFRQNGVDIPTLSNIVTVSCMLHFYSFHPFPTALESVSLLHPRKACVSRVRGAPFAVDGREGRGTAVTAVMPQFAKRDRKEWKTCEKSSGCCAYLLLLVKSLYFATEYAWKFARNEVSSIIDACQTRTALAY